MANRLESLELLSNSGIVMSDETISTKCCHSCFNVKKQNTNYQKLHTATYYSKLNEHFVLGLMHLFYYV